VFVTGWTSQETDQNPQIEITHGKAEATKFSAMHWLWQAASLPEQLAGAEVRSDLQHVEVPMRTANLDLGKTAQ
jgi:hypothetical protein